MTKVKDFRVLVKVDPSQPEKALKFLSKKVTGDPFALRDSDLEFIKKQDYIVASPVEISLDVETRAKLLYLAPNVRFIVTGVPANRVKNLIEYGYVAYSLALDEQPEEEEGDVPPEEEKKPVKVEEKNEPVEDPKTVKEFWVNGKKVSEEEFDEKVSELSKDWDKIFKDGRSRLLSFLD